MVHRGTVVKRPSCPYLPTPEDRMTHQCLTDLRSGPADVFYFKALQYANYLWQHGHSGRAILALTRGLYTGLAADADILKKWPRPYAGLKWIVVTHDNDDFPGNPRISFQHQATRLQGQHRDLRRARAWAAWALVCAARPNLLADTKQKNSEPSLTQIEDDLVRQAGPEEALVWKNVLES